MPRQRAAGSLTAARPATMLLSRSPTWSTGGASGHPSTSAHSTTVRDTMADTAATPAQANPAAQEISPEYSPMTGLDEFLVHNSPMPVRVMYTPDVRAYE